MVHALCRTYEAVPLGIRLSDRIGSHGFRLKELFAMDEAAHEMAGSHCNQAASFLKEKHSIVQCTRKALALRSRPQGRFITRSTRLNVVLAVSESPASSILTQVAELLPLLHSVWKQGLLPSPFLGRYGFASSHRCSPHMESRYHASAAGDNVWEYFFKPVSPHAPGNATLVGRSLRVFVAWPAASARMSVAETEQSGLARQENSSLKDLSQSVRTFLRVRPELLTGAAQLMRPWRHRANSVLGVALEGGITHNSTALDLAARFLQAHGRAAFIVIVSTGGLLARSARSRFGSQVILPSCTSWCEESDDSPFSHRRAAEVGKALSRPAHGCAEVLDAVLLAHCDYILSDNHVAAQFARWYAPHLHEAHLDVASVLRGEVASARRPWWAGGTWQPVQSPETRVRNMLSALESSRGLPGASMLSALGNGGKVEGFEPGLPPPKRRAQERVSPWVLIVDGKCSDASAAVMGFDQCKAFAAQDKKHFLGQSVDKAEYPGCTLWVDTQVVEFNGHADERMGCNISPRGKCACLRKAKGAHKHAQS